MVSAAKSFEHSNTETVVGRHLWNMVSSPIATHTHHGVFERGLSLNELAADEALATHKLPVMLPAICSPWRGH